LQLRGGPKNNNDKTKSPVPVKGGRGK